MLKATTEINRSNHGHHFLLGRGHHAPSAILKCGGGTVQHFDRNHKKSKSSTKTELTAWKANIPNCIACRFR